MGDIYIPIYENTKNLIIRRKPTMQYPKIETLFARDEKTFKVTPWKFKLPEFEIIDSWLVTEKIDGTNVRIILNEDGTVRFGGRTDQSQMPTTLFSYLQDTFPKEKIQAAFDPGTKAVIFGEGYGAGIQKGGNYRKDPAVRIFDVAIISDHLWWLMWEDVRDVANKLGIETVPFLGWKETTKMAVHWVRNPFTSLVSAEEGGNPDYIREGIVARSNPLLLLRNGERVIWKLKTKDFDEKNREIVGVW